MDIIFKGRHTGLQERFRRHATAKLGKIGKLDQKAIRIDVEVSQERNPRQSDRRERVELTIRSRGPAIRAEAAADDRYVALDRAVAKLEARLRRACDRRKSRHAGPPAPGAGYFPDPLDEQFADGLPVLAADEARTAGGAPQASNGSLLAGSARLVSGAPDGDASDGNASGGHASEGGSSEGGASDGGRGLLGSRPGDGWADGNGAQPRSGAFVPIAMEGDGPLVVREKFHAAAPMTIDQALLEMELVGHDFFLFCDRERNLPSVVYRRRGYDYGVIRLVEEPASGTVDAPAGGAAGRQEWRVGQNRVAG
jgi:ribosomal subunit interface protein